LVNKYDVLLNQVACATNPSTCVASLEQEKKVLNEKLEKLTSEHMTLQARHKELECTHEMLVESYTCLEVAHEVVLSSVKSTQPLSHTARANMSILNCLVLNLVVLKQANLVLSMYL
jgi:predicted nuclease with TOPRIM domain